MCRKNIYYNTYADGAQDVTEKTTACRDGKRCSHPEVHQYERSFRFNKLRDSGPESHKSVAERKPTPYFLGDLPTPRRSKSPSPANRRGSGVYDLYDRPDRDRDHHHSSRRHRDSRHPEREPPSPRHKRSQPHFVVIDQPARSSSRDIPLGPVHLVDEYGSRRRASREREREHHHRRHHSPGAQAYIVDDERERRRHNKRRMSGSAYPDFPTATSGVPAAEIYTAEPRRYPGHMPGLRRSATLGHTPMTVPGTSAGMSPPRTVRWQDEVSARRARQNAEIAGRGMPPEVLVHQEPPKGILKDSKGKGTDRELRRAVESMGMGTGMGRERRGSGSGTEHLDLYNRDRLKARLGGGGDNDGGRERRRKSKVWTGGDQYQYF